MRTGIAVVDEAPVIPTAHLAGSTKDSALAHFATGAHSVACAAGSRPLRLYRNGQLEPQGRAVSTMLH